MKKKIIIACIALCTVGTTYAFTFTSSCGKKVTTSFGNCTPEERQAYLMELDEILCGEN